MANKTPKLGLPLDFTGSVARSQALQKAFTILDDASMGGGNGGGSGGGSLRVVYTSSTCTSDSNLSMTGFATGADQTAKLQAILDQAAAGPLLVIWDGAYTVKNVSATECLRMRSNTWIQVLPGCGGINMAESLTPMFRNYNPNINPSTYTDKNLRISGGTWHGNRANQSVKETVGNGGIFLFDFIGVDGLHITDGLELRKAKAFAFRAANCYNINILDSNIDFGAGNADLNTDGWHFNGPCKNITIRNTRISNYGDDAIGLNADDAWAAAGGVFGPYGGVYGDITNVKIDGVYLDGYAAGIRVLSGSSRVDNVSINNVSGKTGAYWLVVDNYNPSDTILTGPGNVGTLDIRNVSMENTVPATGSWTQCGAHFNCKIDQVTLANLTKTKFLSTQFPAIQFGAKADIGSATIDGYCSYPVNNGGYTYKQILFIAGAKVRSMTFQNCKFDVGVGSGNYPIHMAAGVAINQLNLLGNTGQNFTDFVFPNGATIGASNIPATSNFMNVTTDPTTWSLDTLYTEVSPTAITYNNTISTGAAVNAAKKIASDAFGGNVQLSSRVRFTGTTQTAHQFALLVRGTSIQPWTGTGRNAYQVDINKVTGVVQMNKTIAGVATAIGPAITVSGGFAIGADYDVKLTVKATALSTRIQRVSDSLYLQTDGTWGATAVDCATGTDSALAAASGQYGVYTYCRSSDNTTAAGVMYTNFGIAAAP